MSDLEPEVNYTTYTIKKADGQGNMLGDTYSSQGYGKNKISPSSVLGRLHSVNQMQMLVCITMYNEKKAEFISTMRGIMYDINVMVKNGRITNPHNQFCVVLIADGIEKVNQEFYTHMTNHKLYSEEAVAKYYKFDKLKGEVTLKHKELFEDKEQADQYQNNIVHCFSRENMVDFGFQREDKAYISGATKSAKCVGINFIFAIKHNNGGKLNSHLFYFRGFCQYLQPEYATLIDIGTEVRHGAIDKLLKHMNDHPDCGGACGEIEVDTSASSFTTFLVIYGQYFEYKISNYLDKMAEQFFGFISVLPGAFSIFRMQAIKGKPLREYFKGLQKEKNNCFMANMYLAEDRIMCLEILTHQGQRNKLAFVPGATAVTDPPTTVPDLLRQRRRWINGSNFAQFYVIQNFCALQKTDHPCCSKCVIFVFYVYYVINSAFSFIIVGMFYSSFSIMIRDFMSQNDPIGTEDPTGNTPLVRIFESLYLLLIIWMLLLSLSINVKLASCQITLISVMSGLLMFFFVILAYYYFLGNLQDAITNDSSSDEDPTVAIIILVSMGVVIFSQIIPLCINCRCNLCKIIMGFISYLFLTPTYVNMFIIYSFCNVHDVTWGNRATNLSEEMQKKDDEFKAFRSNVLILWIIFNVLGSYILNSLVRGGNADGALLAFSVFLAFTVFFRLISAIMSRLCQCCPKGKVATIKQKEWDRPKQPSMPCFPDNLNKIEGPKNR